MMESRRAVGAAVARSSRSRSPASRPLRCEYGEARADQPSPAKAPAASE